MCKNNDTFFNGWILCTYLHKEAKHYARWSRSSLEHFDTAYDYIIPFKNFDPNDIEGSIKNYNIQK